MAAWLMLAISSRCFAAPDAAPYFVDLSKVANRDLQDDVISRNGQGGWIDDGINDFFVYPQLTFGESTWRGTPFKLIDPAKNQNRAVVVLAGETHKKDLPRNVIAEVPQIKSKYLYVMHTSVCGDATKSGDEIASYTLTYDDRSTATLRIRRDRELQHWQVGQWWDGEGTARYPVYMGRNARSGAGNAWVGVWATQWENPSPTKAITSITFASVGADSPIIFAVTLAGTDFAAMRDAKENRLTRPAEPPPDFFDTRINGEKQAIFSLLKSEKLVEGVRRVELVKPDVLAVTVDSALGEIVFGQGEAIAAAYQNPERFSISSDEDELFGKDGMKPARVTRQTQRVDVRDVGPFLATQLFWHTFYLQLDSPLKVGKTYTVNVKKMPAGFTASMKIKFDPTSLVVPMIKVNQVGYSTLADERWAYLGWWVPEVGPVDFSAYKQFEVIDETSGVSVLRGDLATRRASDKFCGEEVSEMNLAALIKGQYHILIPGLGRSHSFRVGGEFSRDLYFNTHRALMHQRCGAALTKNVTDWPREECHVEKGLRGGYHEAGSTDVLSTQLQGTSATLSVAEAFSGVFHDKDLQLPESGRGVPDVLSEAAWALRFYAENQQEDGGVPFGRPNDCPRARRLPDAEILPSGVYRAKCVSSAAFAAVAGQFARLIKPFDAAQADRMLAKAEKAYAWAKANTPAGDSKDLTERQWKPTLGWAAAELFKTTGKDEYNEDFRTAYLAKDFRGDWQSGDRACLYLWPYVTTNHPNIDGVIQEQMRNTLINLANTVVRMTQEPGYRMGRGADEGGWGNLVGGGPYGNICLRAYLLTREQKYLNAASLNADFQLGCNPLGICFISGMGTRFPQNPQLDGSLQSGHGVTVKGFSVNGPGSANQVGYPATIPPWRRYEDSRASAAWSGFSISETLGPAAAMYSTFWALEQRK